jgi:hypothetical protein
MNGSQIVYICKLVGESEEKPTETLRWSNDMESLLVLFKKRNLFKLKNFEK